MSQLLKRNNVIDIIKAFAVCLMVIGHSIQCGSGKLFFESGKYFDNNIFKFIYSFHMPLFMSVSGFLFYHSTVKHRWQDILKNKFSSLIIPVWIWSLVPFIIEVLGNGGGSVLVLVKTYVLTAVFNFWFLWAVFYCSIVVLAVSKLFNGSIWIYFLLFILTFFTPDSYNFHVYKFMYLYFVAGFFVNKYTDKIRDKAYKLIYSWKAWLFLCMFLLLLLCFYDRDSYIYTSRYTLLGRLSFWQFKIDLYRFLIGGIGTVWAIQLLILLYPKLPNIVKKSGVRIGSNSLEIYIISSLLFTYVLPALAGKLTGINYFFTFAETLGVIAVSMLISIMIKRLSWLNSLLFGGRK